MGFPTMNLVAVNGSRPFWEKQGFVVEDRPDLAEKLAGYEAEARYLRQHEWAVTGADMLWRRSKLGLHLAPGSEALVNAWISAQPPV